jgi:Glycoside hydrolase family 44
MRRLALVLCVMFMLSVGSVRAQDRFVIYDDGLAENWLSWSWDTQINLEATTLVQSGTQAVSVAYESPWAGAYLRSPQALPAGYHTLRFWIHGGEPGGQLIRVDAYGETGSAITLGVIQAQAEAWQQVEISLDAFGASSGIWGFVWQDNSGTLQPIFYLDNIELLAGQMVAQQPARPGPALRVDAAADKRTISPLIYGSNQYASDDEFLRAARPSIVRWGGNATSRYNYLLDATNLGSDWFFQNIPNEVEDETQLPLGSTVNRFISANRDLGIDSLITVPLLGWTTANRIYAECAFRISLYGPQQQVDQWYPDCGNGVRPDGSLITGNNPMLTSIPIDEKWVQDWIRLLISQFGSANEGGVRFYNLDNEVSLWQHTHRDVRPQPLSSLELRDLTWRYAAAIKAIDPGAKTLGPVEYGWTGYHFSGADQASQQWDNPPEAALRGGLPLVPWYLEQMRLYEQQNGLRILDYLDLHYYPSQDNIAIAPAGNAERQALRLRSTRSLWDATYVDESWISEPVMLIPRMREWVDKHYPGTLLAISEYNFGGGEHINGALTQADVLGIFGREGLDLATKWAPPSAYEPGAFAFKMYRNYDGQGGTFGEMKVRAESDDQGMLSVYAAVRADGALTVIIINKSGAPLTSPLQIANFNGGTAQLYRYSNADLTKILQEADVVLESGAVTLTYPADSITLLVISAQP